MSSNIYAITNLEGYVSQMREAVAQNLSENYNNNENLDNFITIKQMINLVNKECLGFDDNNRPLLDEDTNAKIFENTSVWMYNVGLAQLAGQDLVECAWDTDQNEMIFWQKEKTKNAKPKRKNK